MASGPLLVTGAAGCIGAWIVARLSQVGREVVALDRSDDRRRLCLAMDEGAARALPWESVDISDAAALCDVVMRLRPQAIIHLAALQIPFCVANLHDTIGKRCHRNVIDDSLVSPLSYRLLVICQTSTIFAHRPCKVEQISTDYDIRGYAGLIEGRARQHDMHVGPVIGAV